MVIVRGSRPGRRWTRLAHGLYVRADEPDDLGTRLRAWSLLLPESAVFTSLTAAALRGWWLPARLPQPVFAAVAASAPHPQRPGLALTRLRRDPDGEELCGVRVATAPETLLAAARDLTVLDLVPLADSALRLGDCTVAELAATAAARRRGAPALRRVLPLLDPRSESAWESVLRVLHRAAGIEVEPQHEIRDAYGRFVARADLWLVGTRRIHEYDGEVHRGLAVHRRDLDRDRRLVETGWQRCGYTAGEVLGQGPRIIASADAVLGRRWQPERARAWQALVADSLYAPAGRARVAARWASSNC
jgi:very-short-patch-repair endonuclease